MNELNPLQTLLIFVAYSVSLVGGVILLHPNNFKIVKVVLSVFMWVLLVIFIVSLYWKGTN